MELKLFQEMTARLYCDRNFREAFLHNPVKNGIEFGLDRESSLSLARQCGSQINYFSRSLAFKRLRELRRLLPMLAQTLGPSLDNFFIEYSLNHPLDPSRYLGDAVLFVMFLCQRGNGIPVWALDLARWESAWLQARNNGQFYDCMIFKQLPVSVFSNTYLGVNTNNKYWKGFYFWIRLGSKKRLFSFKIGFFRSVIRD